MFKGLIFEGDYILDFIYFLDGVIRQGNYLESYSKIYASHDF